MPIDVSMLLTYSHWLRPERSGSGSSWKTRMIRSLCSLNSPRPFSEQSGLQGERGKMMNLFAKRLSDRAPFVSNFGIQRERERERETRFRLPGSLSLSLPEKNLDSAVRSVCPISEQRSLGNAPCAPNLENARRSQKLGNLDWYCWKINIKYEFHVPLESEWAINGKFSSARSCKQPPGARMSPSGKCPPNGRWLISGGPPLFRLLLNRPGDEEVAIESAAQRRFPELVGVS